MGPIGQAAHELHFDAIHLLTDHAPKQSRRYREWLKERLGMTASLHRVRLSSPTRFDEIYEAAIAVLDELDAGKGSDAQFVYHLSPGTPAMAAVWIVLAKTSHPAELIESSLEDGVHTVSFPFEIAAEYLPHIQR